MSERYEVEAWDMGNGAFVYDGEEVSAIAECDDISNANMIAAALNAAERDKALFDETEEVLDGLLRAAASMNEHLGQPSSPAMDRMRSLLERVRGRN